LDGRGHALAPVKPSGNRFPFVLAHIAGIPVEEALLSFGPVILMVVGALVFILRRTVDRTVGRFRRVARGRVGKI
jgi:hypothetical protein